MRMKIMRFCKNFLDKMIEYFFLKMKLNGYEIIPKDQITKLSWS